MRAVFVAAMNCCAHACTVNAAAVPRSPVMTTAAIRPRRELHMWVLDRGGADEHQRGRGDCLQERYLLERGGGELRVPKR